MKYALPDVVNIPSWHKQDKMGTEFGQPALMMKHMSIDMQRTFTKVRNMMLYMNSELTHIYGPIKVRDFIG